MHISTKGAVDDIVQGRRLCSAFAMDEDVGSIRIVEVIVFVFVIKLCLRTLNNREIYNLKFAYFSKLFISQIAN